jgi:hypothetical protein
MKKKQNQKGKMEAKPSQDELLLPSEGTAKVCNLFISSLTLQSFPSRIGSRCEDKEASALLPHQQDLHGTVPSLPQLLILDLTTCQNVVVPSLRAAWLLQGKESRKAQRSGEDYEFDEFEVGSLIPPQLTIG